MSALRAEIVSQKAGVFAPSLASVEAARRRNPIRLISGRTLDAKAKQGKKGKGGERANLTGRERPKNRSVVLRSVVDGKRDKRESVTRGTSRRTNAAIRRARIDWILGQHLQPYRAREFIRARVIIAPPSLLVHARTRSHARGGQRDRSYLPHPKSSNIREPAPGAAG